MQLFGYHARSLAHLRLTFRNRLTTAHLRSMLPTQVSPGMKDKIRRTLTSIFPIAADRQGECNNCGACCKLPRPCVFLGYRESGESYCRIYRIRPLNCRKYPRTASELVTADTSSDAVRGYFRQYPRTASELVTADTCGYTFAGVQVRRGSYSPQPVTSER